MTLPSALTTFTSPGTSTAPLSSPAHDIIHSEILASLQGLETTIGTSTSTDAMSLVNRLNNMVGRNRIRNAEMVIAQRGDGPLAAGASSYLIDGIKTFTNGSTASVSRQAFATGAAPLPDTQRRYYSRTITTSSAGAGNYCYVSLFGGEGVDTFAGQTVTFSVWLKTSGGEAVSFEASQQFGTGGSPSATINEIAKVKWTTTTSWAKYSLTFDVPSIVGKTLGTDNTDALVLTLWFDAGSTYSSRSSSLGQRSATYDFFGPQLERGPVASSLEHVSTPLAIANNYRFFQSYGAYEWVGQATATTEATFFKVLSPKMRAVPTLSFPAGPYTAHVVEVGNTTFTPTALTGTVASVSNTANMVAWKATGMTGLTVGKQVLWVGSAVTLSAEI